MLKNDQFRQDYADILLYLKLEFEPSNDTTNNNLTNNDPTNNNLTNNNPTNNNPTNNNLTDDDLEYLCYLDRLIHILANPQ